MRVLHAPCEVAGQASVSVLGLRQIGVSADLLAPVHPFEYENAPDYIVPRSRIGALHNVARAIHGHDVFHYHYGEGMLPRCLDARLLSEARRKVIVEFHGSDVRVPSIERRRNPHYVQIEGEDDHVAIRRMQRWANLSRGHAVYSDPSLRLFLEPHFRYLRNVPLRIDLALYQPCPPSPHARRTTIVHAPSSQAGKGTRFVREAVQKLESEGIPVEYVELHGLGHREARQAYARADLVVDQLCSGAHGVASVEGMALAKPVLCYLLAEAATAYPEDLPIINVSPATIFDVLVDWCERPGDRHELGLASREYAERVHDARAVAEGLVEIYRELPGR